MPAALLMVLSTLLFALMAVAVKLASEHYSAAEIVLYRGLIGASMMGVLARRRRVSLATQVPGMHLWRCSVGVAALLLWYVAIGGLPLATAITLNYMSSVWIAVFLVVGALRGAARVDARVVGTVLAGFVGVGLVLQPTWARDQIGMGLIGLASGLLSALAYMQLAALGRAGEPELRVVFYFSLGSVLAGLMVALAAGGLHRHDASGLALLLAVGVLATLAQLLLTRAYAVGAPLVNASLQYLGIVFSFLFGVGLFGDPVHAAALAGAALIVASGVTATALRSAPARQLQRDAPRASDPSNRA